MKKTALFVISLFFLSVQFVGQQDTVAVEKGFIARKFSKIKDTNERKYSLLALPFAYYSPETRWAFGGSGIYNFYLNKKDSVSNSSQMVFGAAWTQNDQVLFYIPYQFYWKENQWKATGEIGYYKFSYDFYGVGNDIAVNFSENFKVDYPRFRIHLLKRLSPNIFIGGQYWFENFNIDQSSFEVGKLLETNAIYGGDGGITAGIGFLAQYDTRDNVYNPYKGVFVQGTIHTNSKYTLSDYSFDRYRIDFRYYQSVAKNHVFASQLFVDHITGQPPFTQMAFFGGSKRARGYYEGRFRDKNMFLAQLEYRATIGKRLGGVLFADYGMVSDKLTSLSTKNGHYSYGAGLRFTTDLEKRVSFRLDYAITPIGNSFYFTFGEAF